MSDSRGKEKTEVATSVVSEIKSPTIAVISLNIGRIGKFITYKNKSAKEKIEEIISRISRSLTDLEKEKKEKDTKWIIATWREYGISDADRKSISVQDKTNLKESIAKLTKENPKLIIVTGPTLIRKEVLVTKENLIKIKSYFRTHDWMKNDSELKAAEQKVDALLEKFVPGMKMITFKNSLFVAVGGEIIHRSAKHAIYFETEHESALDNFLVIPAKNRNSNPIVKIKGGPTLGFDICRDQLYGVMFRANASNEPVDIQFVLSDSTDLLLNHLRYKKGVVQVDSEHGTVQVLPPDHSTSLNVYKQDVLEKDAKLELVAALYPLQYQAKEYLQKYQEWEKSHRKHPGIVLFVNAMQSLAEIKEVVPSLEKRAEIKETLQNLQAKFQLISTSFTDLNELTLYGTLAQETQTMLALLDHLHSDKTIREEKTIPMTKRKDPGVLMSDFITIIEYIGHIEEITEEDIEEVTKNIQSFMSEHKISLDENLGEGTTPLSLINSFAGEAAEDIITLLDLPKDALSKNTTP